MALSLPPRTQNMVNQGSGLLAEYHRQGLALHSIAYKQKEVAAKVDEMITKFKSHDVMRRPHDTIVLLKEVQNNYQRIEDNINVIQKSEKELSALIQNIMARQSEGETESNNVNAQLVSIQSQLNSVQQQIKSTQEELNKMSEDLKQLQKNIEDAERRASKKKKRRRWWSVATILTGVAVIGAIGAFKSVKAAKAELGHRREMHAKTETMYKRLQTTFQMTVDRKTNLENDQRQKNFELKQIEEMLNRLRPTLQGTVEFRNYLLLLQDAFATVNNYVQHLEKNLASIGVVQEAGYKPDEPLNVTVTRNYEHLTVAWNAAKRLPAVQTTLNLQDSNNPEATFNAITDLHLPGRGKRSLDLDDREDHQFLILF